ncbi:MAG: hypothetical protein BWK79_11615 [Beggiatoa sp. IS2]|nr:MAG: hypothetical protein BWK79_11615 [Beggiatoa sp. IS2]
MNIQFVNFVVISSLLITSCAPGTTMPAKQTSGAVLGGVLGGVAGSQVGGGRGRDVAMVVGTILGAAIGGAVGASMDETDKQQTAKALENTPTNQTVSWKNPDTNAEYSVTPTRTYEQAGTNCRDFATKAVINGKKETVYGTACRQPDGTWKVIK